MVKHHMHPCEREPTQKQKPMKKGKDERLDGGREEREGRMAGKVKRKREERETGHRSPRLESQGD